MGTLHIQANVAQIDNDIWLSLRQILEKLEELEARIEALEATALDHEARIVALEP
jgi:uncharacterized protein YjcR